MSERVSPSPSAVAAERLLFGQGTQVWKPGSRFEGGVPYMHRQLTIDYDPALFNTLLDDIYHLVQRLGIAHAISLGEGDGKITVTVPAEHYATLIEPRIAQTQGVLRPKFRRRRTVCEQDERQVMRARLRGLLFENGRQAWGADASELTGNHYRRLFDASELWMNQRPCEWDDALEAAREIMQEHTGITTLRGQQLDPGTYAFLIPSDDYQEKLGPRLGDHDAGELGGTISHIDRMAERHKTLGKPAR